MTKLDGATVKLTRARKHIEALGTEAEAYLGSKPFVLDQEEEPNGDLIWRVRIVEQVPPDLSGIIGDAVHNMRSALDFVAWQLVEVGGGTPSRYTCFPIGQAQRTYGQMLRRALAGAPSRAIRLIRILRPYEGGNPILARLHALDIVDKHRLLLVVGAAHKHVVATMTMRVPWHVTPIQFPPVALNPADRQFPLKDGTVVFRICSAARESVITPQHNESVITPQHNVVFELAFGDGDEVKGLPLLETLLSMHDHVSKIVKIIDRHFFS